MGRALVIAVPAPGLKVELALERLCPTLVGLGFSVEILAKKTAAKKVVSEKIVAKKDASRTNILAALAELGSKLEPDEPCLLYYFGHGGRVHFNDLEDSTTTDFSYISTTTRAARDEFADVLGLELSAHATKLERRCHNVTVILDCCHSATMVRSKNVPLATRQIAEAPDWVADVITSAPTLALDSHPRIVRLCGSSPRRTAYAATRGGRHIGRLTEALLETLARAGDGWRDLCWDAIIHELREQVIERVGNEGQWVALAGPRLRRLFSRQRLEWPGTVTALASGQPTIAQLRAGWHQGVRVGDCWALAATRVDASGRPRPLIDGRVIRVESNLSVLELKGAVELPLASPAYLLHAATKMPVAVSPDLASAMENSAWLRPASDEPVAVLEADGDGVRVRHLKAAHLSRRFPTNEQLRALTLLEDWARLSTLEFCLDDKSTTEAPIDWSWFRVGSDPGDPPRTPLPTHGARLIAGERFCVELSNTDMFDPWFVSVVLADPSGHLRLLNTRMPEGLELAAKTSESLGLRLGATRQGIELRWPEGVDDTSGPATLWFLAARRPICLAHIVRPQELDQDSCLDLQSIGQERLRGHGAELSQGAAWWCAPFTLIRGT